MLFLHFIDAVSSYFCKENNPCQNENSTYYFIGCDCFMKNIVSGEEAEGIAVLVKAYAVESGIFDNI